MKRIELIFAFFILLGNVLNAQVKVTGTVYGQDSIKIYGAKVSIDGKTVISDKNGNFEFQNVTKNKKLLLTVEATGYEQYKEFKTFNSDFVLNVYLIPQVTELNEVVISAVRAPKNAPFAYTTIKADEIEKENIGQDIPYIIKTVPSVIYSSDAGTGIGYTNMFIRGVDITRINVTINGVPLNDPESHGVWWVDVPDIASSSNSIQIQRGVGTSTNGTGAFGASLNIQTNQLNNKAYSQIDLSYGSFNSYRATAKFGTGKINNHFIFEGRVSKIHSDGYIDRAWANLNSFQLSGAYVNKNTIVQAIVSSGLEKTYQAWYGVPKDSLLTNRTYNYYTYDNEIDHYTQTHYQFIVNHKFSDKLILNSTSFLVRGYGYYEQYKDAENYSDYGLKPVVVNTDTIFSTDLIRRKWLDNDFFGENMNLFYNPSKNLKFVLAGSFNRYIGDHFGRIIWMQYAGNIPVRKEWYRNTGYKNDFNTFFKTMYKLDKLYIYADLQYRKVLYTAKGIDDDLSTISLNHSYNFFNPKLGLNYEFNKKHSVYASVAVAHREPKRSDFIDAPTDKTPLPERLTDYELGYNFSSAQNALQVNLYYMDYTNQLILTGQINDVGTPIVTNAPKSFRRGVELIYQQRLSFLTWNANLTLSQNKILNFTEYVDNWDYWDDPANNDYQITSNLGTTDISFSPSIIASSTIEFNLTKFMNLDFISKYVGRQYIDNTSSIERSLDPYFVNDIRLNTHFKSIDFGISVNNVFNEMYETYAWVYSYYYQGKRYAMDGYFPQAGRNYMLNLKIKF